MSPSISAAVFALVAQALAFVTVRVVNLNADRGFVMWALSVPPIFFIVEPLAVIMVIGALMLVVAPVSAAQRVAFYLLVVPCVPGFVQADLPFPGINFLAVMSHHRVAVIALLLPLLLYARSSEHPRKSWTVADFCIIGFAIYTSTAVGNSINATSGLRFFVEQALTFAIPYLAVVRALETREDLETCLRAFLVCSIILACVAFVATVKQWDFYRFNEPSTVMTIPDFRGGLLRISATANTHSLGFHLVAGLLFLEHLKPRMSLGFVNLMLLRGLLLGGVFVTGSRGALTALAAGAAVYLFFTIRRPGLRKLYLVVCSLTAIGGVGWLLAADHSKIDPYGTFDYRQQLLTTSLDYIGDHFFFGDLGFAGSGKFNHLVQGQGIVDITNLYLQIALNYGMIGFALYFLVFLQTALGLFAGAQREAKRSENAPCAVLLAALAGWLVLMATTSDVGLTTHLGIMLAALGRVAYVQSKEHDRWNLGIALELRRNLRALSDRLKSADGNAVPPLQPQTAERP